MKIVDESHDSPEFDSILPIEGSVESIRGMLENKDELYIITARPIGYKNKTEKWIKRCLNTSDIEINYSGDFHIGQAAKKAEICKEKSIQLILEDSPQTSLECVNNGVNALLFDRPWNKQFNHEKIKRVYNWSEALKEINLLRKDY